MKGGWSEENAEREGLYIALCFQYFSPYLGGGAIDAGSAESFEPDEVKMTEWSVRETEKEI